MSEYLNEDICQFSNDASASSFGWNFQANAGIFLFLKYMPDAADIKIESISQDIEITLIDERKVFAQAKSAQDSTTIKDQKEKFKDATKRIYIYQQYIRITVTRKTDIHIENL